MFHKVLRRRTTLSAASRSENSYLREAIEGGAVAPLGLNVINANGETDICDHCPWRRNEYIASRRCLWDLFMQSGL